MRVWRMRTGISIDLSAADRRRLEALVRDRNTPQKHGWRAEIVHFSADGLGTVEIMRRPGKAKTCVWRWQDCFAEEGVEACCATRGAPRAYRRSEPLWRAGGRPARRWPRRRTGRRR